MKTILTIFLILIIALPSKAQAPVEEIVYNNLNSSTGLNLIPRSDGYFYFIYGSTYGNKHVIYLDNIQISHEYIAVLDNDLNLVNSFAGPNIDNWARNEAYLGTSSGLYQATLHNAGLGFYDYYLYKIGNDGSILYNKSLPNIWTNITDSLGAVEYDQGCKSLHQFGANIVVSFDKYYTEAPCGGYFMFNENTGINISSLALEYGVTGVRKSEKLPGNRLFTYQYYADTGRVQILKIEPDTITIDTSYLMPHALKYGNFYDIPRITSTILSDSSIVCVTESDDSKELNVFRIDTTGNLLWQTKLGNGLNRLLYALSVEEGDDGYIYVGSTSRYVDTGSYHPPMRFQLDMNGNLLNSQLFSSLPEYTWNNPGIMLEDKVWFIGHYKHYTNINDYTYKNYLFVSHLAANNIESINYPDTNWAGFIFKRLIYESDLLAITQKYYPDIHFGSPLIIKFSNIGLGNSEYNKIMSNYFFPNPTSGITSIYLEKQNNNILKIENQLGQELNIKPIIINNILQIDLSIYPIGIYYITININNQLQTFKIIKL